MRCECAITLKVRYKPLKTAKSKLAPNRTDTLFFKDELNQIGIKIDMYGQEYRFSPAFACIQAVCRLVRCIYSCSIARISSSVGTSTIPT